LREVAVLESTSIAVLEELVTAGVGVHQLSDFVAVWAAQRASFGWFFGAGISASAGVPTATAVRDRLLCERYAIEHDLVRQELDESDPTILQRVHRYFDGRNGMPALGSDGDYSAAFELVMPDEAARKRYLEEQFAGARPGFGHRVLGGLLVAGYCDLVITTNFDPLIEQGFTDALRRGTDAGQHVDRELNVAGLESSARARVAFQSQRWPLAVKLHGDFRERRLMNTEPELREQDADLRRLVIDASRTFGIVVCGYSGRDASVMEMFRASASEPDAWPQGFWWMVRSPDSVPDAVRELLLWLASKGVAAHLVSARSFDETMGAIARQAVVEPEMRRYLDGLRPKGRVIAAALPKPSSKWPVLRFNALPLVAARMEIARVVLPAGWRRSDVRAVLVPRPKWPVVVCGPGEVLALGDPEDAQSQLASKAAQRGLDPPSEAGTVVIDPLAVEAASHHHSVLVQLIAQMLTETLPVRMQATKSGAARLIVEGPRQGEPSHFETVRKQLRVVYGEALYGESSARCGLRDGKRRRFAEEVGLDFDLQAGRAWLLLRPHTWVESPGNPVADRELDPATPWVNERWALRRRNEFWAELIKVWSELIAPEDRTVLTLAGLAGVSEPIARVEIGRINAFSRPNQQEPT
jgi:hypothetical protein